MTQGGPGTLCPGREATGSLTIRKRCKPARQSHQEQINVVKRRVYDDEKHIHFVTCSCYRRRKYLEVDHAKRIVIGQLGSKLANPDARCPGFVVLPDHVHALIWFPQIGQLASS
ncbi:MAG: hypothetical protein ACI93T_003694 [Porticoccaceae bacterium]